MEKEEIVVRVLVAMIPSPGDPRTKVRAAVKYADMIQDELTLATGQKGEPIEKDDTTWRNAPRKAAPKR